MDVRVLLVVMTELPGIQHTDKQTSLSQHQFQATKCTFFARAFILVIPG